MILDRLDNATHYRDCHSGIRQAFAYLAATDFSQMPDGRIDLDGDTVFALVQRYTTKPKAEGVWEAHRKYIDVQYIANGAEIIGRTHLSQLNLTQPYSDEKDVLLFEGAGDFFSLGTGDFAIFFPEDAHMPGLCAGENPAPVLKVVVKIRHNPQTVVE